MQDRKVIAIFDIGKTNKKVLLFDKTLSLVYREEKQFDTIRDEEDFECSKSLIFNVVVVFPDAEGPATIISFIVLILFSISETAVSISNL